MTSPRIHASLCLIAAITLLLGSCSPVAPGVDETPSDPDSSLNGTAAVSGRITHNGASVANVEIIVVWSAGRQSIRSDSEGNYAVSGIPLGGEVMVRVFPTVEMGLAERNWYVSPFDGDSRKDFDLEQGSLVSGEVRLADGSLYAETFWLGLDPLDSSLPPNEWMGTTVTQGRFRVSLAPGTYSIATEPGQLPFNLINSAITVPEHDLSGLVITLSSEAISPVPISPPIASLIHISEPDAHGVVSVRGEAGAVEGDAMVVVTGLNSLDFVFTTAADDGSFEVDLFAPAGSWIAVKHGYEPHDVELGAQEQAVAWLNAWPGTSLQVGSSETGQGTSFAEMGQVSLWEGKDGAWTFTGTQTVSGSVEGRNMVIRFEGVLRVLSSAIDAGINLESIRTPHEVILLRYFDLQGRRVPRAQVFASNFMTPTGLPISREFHFSSPIHGGTDLGSWRFVEPGIIETTVSGFINVPNDTSPGFYRPAIRFNMQGVPQGNMEPYPRFGYIGNDIGVGHLVMVRVGEPEPPRLTWTLLTNTDSNASRGAVAREDQDSFGLIPHIITQSHQFIIPRTDTRTGLPIAYRLEPFLPLISVADRSIPAPPQIPFRLPGGFLEVTVEKPDGSSDTLGPAPFLQSRFGSPVNYEGKVLDDGGGRIDDTYELTTLDDQFEYTFQQYGQHVIRMRGEVEDIWGNVYTGDATFDVYVARPLYLEFGQLPTTPYEVGNSFSPVLHINPAMPAQVEIQITHLPNSETGQAIRHVIAGQANPYGYFHPGPQEAFEFDRPGEFRVDVHAEYEAPDGTLWLGSATWGNVVETPNSNLIAHGRRGLDYYYPGGAWFFHRQLDISGTFHSMYPYFNGDILWGNQLDSQVGGDAIIPAVSLQDTQGSIYQIIRQRWETQHSNLAETMGFEPRMAADEAPLFSTTSNGTDLVWSPELIDHYAYAYRSSERPGIRLHETVSEDSLGIGYWRFNAEFGGQAGFEGDLPNDIKWQFGGAVFRLPNLGIHQYLIYGSLWVLLPDDDPIGSRVTPPFRAPGGPDGGPIMVLKGQEIDIFFYPLGVQPGEILEVGDWFTFSGHVAPPLDSLVTAEIVSPSGETRSVAGRASKIGWFYDPSSDFVVDEPGVWTIRVHVEHDRPISTGLTPTEYNTGGVLGTDDGEYQFYVVPEDQQPLRVISPQTGMLHWPRSGLSSIPITVAIPQGLSVAAGQYTIRMPGFVLEQGSIDIQGDRFTIEFDPVALATDFPNLDLLAKLANQPGLSDPFVINLLLCDDDGSECRGGMIFLWGDDAFTLAGGS